MSATIDEHPRFWSKVAVAGDCWLWTAATSTSGYGRIYWNRRVENAHRVAYELLVGPIPEGLQLDHLCRVRPCVNPDHLEPVTQRENMRRGIGTAYASNSNRLKTHCPQGHPYDGENTLVRSNGHRVCRTCNRESCASRRRAA